MIDYSPQFYAGKPIRLVQGPLARTEGIFTQQEGEKRVIVMLELLRKADKVRVSRHWIA